MFSSIEKSSLVIWFFNVFKSRKFSIPNLTVDNSCVCIVYTHTHIYRYNWRRHSDSYMLHPFSQFIYLPSSVDCRLPESGNICNGLHSEFTTFNELTTGNSVRDELLLSSVVRIYIDSCLDESFYLWFENDGINICVLIWAGRRERGYL